MGPRADLNASLGGLIIAGADHDGQPFSVFPLERRFNREAFRQAGDSALTLGGATASRPWWLLSRPR